MSTLGEQSLHFKNVYLGNGDAKGREVLGVLMADGKRIEIYVSTTGKSVRIYVDGKEAKVGK